MTLWDIIVEDAAIVGTLILLEAVLSFDNAAVLAAMVRRLGPADRRKALLYGLVGAYGLRIAAILLASFLIKTPILKVLGGGYLLFIAVKHFINLRQHQQTAHGEHSIPVGGWLERLGVPSLVAVIIQVELVDLAFAVDQVVAAVAFTQKISLIIIASMLGILFLRLAASLMARVMDWLPILEHMAYIAVAVVGVKLLLAYPAFAPGGDCVVPFLDSDVIGDGNLTMDPDAEGTVPEGTPSPEPGANQTVPANQTASPPGTPGNETAPPPDTGNATTEDHADEGAGAGGHVAGHCEIPTPIAISITLGLFGVPVLLKLLFGIPRPRDV